MEEDPLMDERQQSHQGFQRIDAVDAPPAQVTFSYLYSIDHMER